MYVDAEWFFTQFPFVLQHNTNIWRKKMWISSELSWGHLCVFLSYWCLGTVLPTARLNLLFIGFTWMLSCENRVFAAYVLFLSPFCFCFCWSPAHVVVRCLFRKAFCWTVAISNFLETIKCIWLWRKHAFISDAPHLLDMYFIHYTPHSSM